VIECDIELIAIPEPDLLATVAEGCPVRLPRWV